MRPGPRKTPTTLKLYRGTCRGKDKRRNEPKPGIIVPRCPKDFPEEAKRIFRRLAPLLIRLGLLTAIDHESFELLCLHGGMAKRAALEMFKEGLTTKDERNLDRKNPLNQLLREHSEAYRKFGALFGLNPADRAEIDLPRIQLSIRDRLLSEDGNKWAELSNDRLAKYIGRP